MFGSDPDWGGADIPDRSKGICEDASDCLICKVKPEYFETGVGPWAYLKCPSCGCKPKEITGWDSVGDEKKLEAIKIWDKMMGKS